MAEKLAIAPDATAGDLHDQLARLGANLMVRALSAIERGSLVLTPQGEEGVTYAAKISKDATRIDWNQTAGRVHDHIRGLCPFPGAWFELIVDGKPVRIKVLRTTRQDGAGAPGELLDDHLGVACHSGVIRILELQRAGRHAMKADEFLRGVALPRGTLLT
jgi:methionyl-tRNA formyltransferase